MQHRKNGLLFLRSVIAFAIALYFFLKDLRSYKKRKMTLLRFYG